MAARYWVAGTATWNSTAGTKWATTSGGAGGAAVPTSSDDVYFDSASDGGGSFTVTIEGAMVCNNFTVSGLDQAMILAASAGTLRVYDNMSLPASNLTVQNSVGFYVSGTSGTKTIGTAGVSMGAGFVFDGAATFSLTSDLLTTGIIYHTAGTLSAGAYNLTCANFISSGTTARVVDMGSGTWTLSGAGGTTWSMSESNYTLTKGTANIVLSDTTTSARGFAGGSCAYNKLTIGGAAGTSTLTITGTNSFTELASTKTVAHTIVFPNVTTTVDAWTITGTAGNVVTMTRTGGSGNFTLSKTSGYLSGIDYLSISNGIGYAPIATWYVGANSTNGGGNTGMIFTARPAPDNFMEFFL